jgi:hypothetical protein
MRFPSELLSKTTSLSLTETLQTLSKSCGIENDSRVSSKAAESKPTISKASAVSCGGEKEKIDIGSSIRMEVRVSVGSIIGGK